MPRRFKYIDLFAGCGGLSWGLMRAGWRGAFAVEKDAFAFSTLRLNLIDRWKHFRWPDWLPVGPHDINEVLARYGRELRRMATTVALVTGGPPCQGFSVNGRRNKNDRRNKLVDSYVSFVELVKPELLFFENVRGFTIGFEKGGSGTKYSDQVIRHLEDLGYNVHSEIVNFGDYGIPQRRRRFILVGSLSRQAAEFFRLLKRAKSAFLRVKGLHPKPTLEQAISDLERAHGEQACPDSPGFQSGLYAPSKNRYQKFMRLGSVGPIPDSHRFPRHQPEIVRRLEHILRRAPRNRHLPNDLRAELGLRKWSTTPLDKALPCPTITSLPDDYIHYAEPRALTVRECARIQSFPDEFHFLGSYTSGGDRRARQVPRYTQVGNAIPPLFGELAGGLLRDILTNG